MNFSTLDYEYFPLELDDCSLLLCNSNVTHNLASSEYNVRRHQCEEGVGILQQQFDGIQSLRDVTKSMLDAVRPMMTEVVYKRCKYIIEENQRVFAFSNALQNKNMSVAGKILKNAHHAMKEEYEITCPEIDFMADFANSRDDILGARMMGGGFGGCTLNLIERGKEGAFVHELNAAYQAGFKKNVTPIAIQIADGASLIRR